MVTKGFSLNEVRKLYFDELGLFYQQLIRVMESGGELKEGTYDKITGRHEEAKSVVNQLRKGIFKVTNKK